MKNHISKLHNIVIGGDLTSLLYAYLTESYFIFSCLERPERCELFDANLDLSPFFFDNTVTTYNTLDNAVKTFGTHKILLYEKLLFWMSFNGLMPFADNVFNIRLEDNDILKVITNNNKVFRFEYDNLFVVQPHQMSGLPAPIKKVTKKYIVTDWFNISRSRKHDYGYIAMNDNFVKEIFFYISSRYDGNFSPNMGWKDVVSISYLNEKHLKDEEFSENYSRIKVRKELKRLGLTMSHGFHMVGGEMVPRFDPPRVAVDGRSKRLLNKDFYEDTKKIKFIRDTEEQIIEKCRDIEVHTHLAARFLSGLTMGVRPYWKVDPEQHRREHPKLYEYFRQRRIQRIKSIKTHCRNCARRRSKIGFSDGVA